MANISSQNKQMHSSTLELGKSVYDFLFLLKYLPNKWIQVQYLNEKYHLNFKFRYFSNNLSQPRHPNNDFKH